MGEEKLCISIFVKGVVFEQCRVEEEEAMEESSSDGERRRNGRRESRGERKRESGWNVCDGRIEFGEKIHSSIEPSFLMRGGGGRRRERRKMKKKRKKRKRMVEWGAE